MIKLLYIVNRIDGPGGLERVLSIKASYLTDNYDYTVHILTLNQDTNNLFYDFSKKIQYHNIKVGGNAFSYLKSYKKGIREKIKEITPDIILVCDDGLKGLLFPLVIGKPCPLIYERHVSKNAELQVKTPNIYQKTITWLKFKLMNFGAKQYDKFVVLTNGNKKEWDLKNITVIPNPLSFYPSTPSSVNNKNVIAVGKQCFQKGYDRLLKAWVLVHESYPEWTLNIYGTINKNENLEALAKTLKISKSVNFHKPVKNIAEKYQESSIYVMSSRYEGFGMVLTEAMAYGVPCVSFNCPYGPSDIINNGEDGFLVPNGNINNLGEKIKTLVKDNELRKKLGSNARQNVKNYLPEFVVKQWDMLFKELLKHKTL